MFYVLGISGMKGDSAMISTSHGLAEESLWNILSARGTLQDKKIFIAHISVIFLTEQFTWYVKYV